jgi:hypothetical protein
MEEKDILLTILGGTASLMFLTGIALVLTTSA